MAGRGRGGGRFGGRGRGWAPSGGGGSRSSGGLGQGVVCACVANTPLLVELRNLDEECLRTGKVKLRHGLKRAMKSLERYPLPVTTEREACALEGVGSFTARRMLRGLQVAAPPATGSAGRTNRTDEENIEPTTSSSAREGSRKSKTTGGSTGAGAGCASGTNTTSMLRMKFRPGGSVHGQGSGGGAANMTGKPLSLASNFAALRGDVDGDGARTPDVTPKRPTSRARREEAGDDTGNIFSSKAPKFFSGQWEARLIVDNREHDFMSMQSTLLQKGVPCETRQLPLGDMLWIARRPDDLTSEVLLGYIVERKTASDLASSIVDGRYEEQKRRLKLSGLRRRIYLVEGNLNHQSQLAPATLRTALVSSQACGGLSVVQCDSLRDSVDFLARTHRHIASLLSNACRTSLDSAGSYRGGGGLWPGCDGAARGVAGGGGGAGGGGTGVLRPAMTYGEYLQGCAKRAGATTIRQLLGAMMRQVPGCSAARAEAVVREFQSPLGLMLALERTAAGEGKTADCERGGRSDGDDDAARMKRVDDVLAGLVCRGGAGTNKLPQPLRRLLCRLFVGESESESESADVDGDAAGGGSEEVEVGVRAQRVVCQGSAAAAGWSGGDPYLEWDVEPMSQDTTYS